LFAGRMSLGNFYVLYLTRNPKILFGFFSKIPKKIYDHARQRENYF